MVAPTEQEALSYALAKLAKLGISVSANATSMSCRVPKGVLDQNTILTLGNLGVTVFESSVNYRKEPGCVVPLSPSTEARVNFICIHTGHGGIFDYRHLASLMPKTFSVYGVHGLSFLLGHKPLTSVGAMADYYVERLQSERLFDRPIVLYGVCTGGYIALEMACRLTQIPDCSVLLLALGDTYYSSNTLEAEIPIWLGFLSELIPKEMDDIYAREHSFWDMVHSDRFGYLADRMSQHQSTNSLKVQDPKALLDRFELYQKNTAAYFRREDRFVWISFVEAFMPEQLLDIVDKAHPFWEKEDADRFRYLAGRLSFFSSSKLLISADAKELKEQFDSYECYSRAYCNYRPQPYSGRSVYIQSSSHDPGEMRAFLAGNARFEDIGGGHLAVLRPPEVNEVAQILCREIDSALAEHSS